MLLGLIWLPVLILGLVFWVRMLIDCVTNESNQGNDKLVWVVIILFANILGALLYWAVRRPQRLAELGR